MFTEGQLVVFTGLIEGPTHEDDPFVGEVGTVAFVYPGGGPYPQTVEFVGLDYALHFATAELDPAPEGATAGDVLAEVEA